MTELTLTSEPASADTDSIDPMLQEAIALVQTERYDAAAISLEQLIEENVATPVAIWHLGLVRLLQKREEEAQLIWTMAMTEAEPDQLERWALDLASILDSEAVRQEKKEQPQTAWLIRRHLREANPSDWHNVLHLVELELELKQFQAESLAELGLVAWLKAEQPSADEMTHLTALIRKLLEAVPQEDAVINLVTEFISRVDHPQDWINPLLEAATHLWTKLAQYYSKALRYAELCHQIDPTHSETLLRLSGWYQDTERYAESITLVEQFLSGAQTTLQRWIGYSLLLRGLMIRGGHWERVTATLKQVTELAETMLAEYEIKEDELLDASILTAPMFFYPYISDSPREARSLQNRVAKLYQDDLNASVKQKSDIYIPYPQAPLVRTVERQKLRVGYLSRCMRAHSVGWLSRWLLHHHDRDRFEIHVLFNQQLEPGPFGREWFAQKADSAYCVEGDILGVAKTIREDEIDILVDLDSITSDLGIGVLALKPAPVQVTWLGLDAAGLPAIDYFIADSYVVPDDADEYYTEKIWRLPQTYLAVDGFEVGIPSLRRDQLDIPSDAVIYLSAQIAYKRHPDTVRRQMQIIREVPNSYFLIKGAGDSQSVQALFLQIAEEEGVAGDRLRFLGRDDTELTHRANLAIADVVLDTFPYNGATTTMETLWMGIPMVTQVGQQFASRNSYGMMMNAGITEGIAHSAEEYVEWGVRLGKDAALREQIHNQLRRSRQTAPLWNAQQFTREMERAYEHMWERYLEG